MTSEGIALKREREAREFIDELIRIGWLDDDLFGDNRNFKPWYSHRSLFQEGITRVYIGIDPGGDPRFPDNTTGPQYQTFLEGDSYNAFLDESWTGNAPGLAPLQSRTRRVFRELYGESAADDLLRQTACFNVCPVRTGASSNIQPDLWDECVEWFQGVINDLKPTTIICNGTGKSSPWAVLNPRQCWSEQIDGGPYLRFGTVQLGESHRSRVIGIPQLTGRNPYSREALFQLLSANVDRLVGHENR